MIEMIEHKEGMIAMIIRKDYNREGIHFFTEENSLLQLGYISHPKDHKIKPHEHNPVHRHIVGTQEVLFVKSGKIKIDFYSYDKTYLESRELSAGDIVLLAGAGHGITVIEAATMIEVKNGPYVEGADKKRFSEDME